MFARAKQRQQARHNALINSIRSQGHHRSDRIEATEDRIGRASAT